MRHLIGTAGGWGGNPDMSIYLMLRPRNDGKASPGSRSAMPVDCSFDQVTTPKATRKNPKMPTIRSLALRAEGGRVDHGAFRVGCDGKIANACHHRMDYTSLSIAPRAWS